MDMFHGQQYQTRTKVKMRRVVSVGESDVPASERV